MKTISKLTSIKRRTLVSQKTSFGERNGKAIERETVFTTHTTIRGLWPQRMTVSTKVFIPPKNPREKWTRNVELAGVAKTGCVDDRGTCEGRSNSWLMTEMNPKTTTSLLS